MKGARYTFFCTAVLFLVLTACQFDEPSLEIIAQDAYDSRTNVLIQTRFSAEEDEHTCEYTLTRKIDSYVEASESPVLPADTVNDHIFDVSTDGKYLFDFHVLDTGGTPIDCLCDDAEFWVDTVNPAAPIFAESYLHTFPDSSLDYFAIFLQPHPDNAAPDEASPVVFYYDFEVDPTLSSPIYNSTDGIQILYSGTWYEIRVMSVDMAGNVSSITPIGPSIYSPVAVEIPHS